MNPKTAMMCLVVAVFSCYGTIKAIVNHDSPTFILLISFISALNFGLFYINSQKEKF